MQACQTPQRPRGVIPGSRGGTPSRLRRGLPLALMLLALFAAPAQAQDYPAVLANTATLTVDGVNDPNPGDNSAVDENTLAIQANVGITKTFLSTGPFVVGQQVQYRIDVANAGPSAARDVVVTDIPLNLRIDSVTGACTTLPCTLASLAPGASVSMELTATILAAGPFSNSATATLPDPDVDPDPDDNEDDGGGGDATAPTATIAVAPASVDEGSGTPLVFTVNFDVAPAVDTVINLSFGGTATPVDDYTGEVVSVTIPAGSTSVSFDVTPVDDDIVEDDETVVVTVIAGDLYNIGGTDSATGTITNDDASADISVAKTLLTAGPFLVGQEVSYSIVVSNAGPSAATGIQVTDTPTNLEIVSVTGACTTLPCTIAELAGGASATINLTARIPAAGTFGNVASATAPDVSDPDPDNNTDDGGGGEAGVPGASISVAPVSVDENSGDALVFTITLDQAPAVDTTITLTYGGTATEGTDYTGAVTTVTILAGETTGTVQIIPVADTEFEPDETVVVTVVAGDLYAIGAPSEAVGTITNDDLPTADLSISKSDGSATYTPGGSATYVITVSNAGPDAATGVVVTDNLPAGVTLAGAWSCSATGGSCASASGGAAGGTQVLVTVDLTATGSATITVPVVFSSNPDDY